MIVKNPPVNNSGITNNERSHIANAVSKSLYAKVKPVVIPKKT
jgi:hypothetical protein